MRQPDRWGERWRWSWRSRKKRNTRHDKMLCGMRTILLLLIASSLGGCHTYRPVEVTVLHGTDDRPMSGIDVQANIMLDMLELFPPKRAPVRTDDRGVAVVNVCMNYKIREDDIFIDAEGYLLDEPSPKLVVRLPWDRVMAPDGAPFRITVHLLTIEAHRSKYPVEDR